MKIPTQAPAAANDAIRTGDPAPWSLSPMVQALTPVKRAQLIDLVQTDERPTDAQQRGGIVDLDGQSYFWSIEAGSLALCHASEFPT